jgi:GT2 family glycosyltransferase
MKRGATPYPQVRYRLQAYTRYLRRALQLLRTEGSAALLKKARRRLGTTSLRVDHRPLLLPRQVDEQRPKFRSPSTPQASVIIPVYGDWPTTLRCLLALELHTKTPAYEVIVVDDGSTDITPERLTECHGVRIVTMPWNQGFIHACNAGASVARAPTLVFLNNDTEVQPGWLTSLLDTFQQQADAAIVGSRLLYPSGRQQEAGGLLFSDGSALNYGHLDDPAKPEYSYARQVDYVSGAALAIPSELFQALGGFDTYFSPAYYEDADLAIRVRSRGLQVWYQPQSRVVHREGATAGLDEGAPDKAKRFQEINRLKFLSRWSHFLKDFGPRSHDLLRQKDRWAQYHILIIDVYMVRPDRDSGSLRLWNLLAVLRNLNAKITFAALNLEAPEPYTSQLQASGVEVLARPHVRSIRRFLKQRGHFYDLVLLSRADTATTLSPYIRAYCSQARLIFDTVDLHFLREHRFAELTNDRTAHRAAAARRRQELAAVAAADSTLVVSPIERDILAQEIPSAEVRLISNIHDVIGSRRSFQERNGILFIGAFAHPPNVDAVIWFCSEIFPLVVQHLPATSLEIVGADPPLCIQRLVDRNVIIHGHMPDVAPLFDSCKISIAPLRFGAGVKGKINQSLAFGLPVVATQLATEGMPLVDRESALIADAPDEFALRVIELCTSQELWDHLSGNGLKVIQKHYSFANARKVLEKLLASTAQRTVTDNAAET